jgi:gamma-butyrobetaine dioxygenase
MISKHFRQLTKTFSRAFSSSPPAIHSEQITPIPLSKHRLSLPPDTDYTINVKKRDIGIEIDGTPYRFGAFFLRDLCPCPKCVDPSTRQKLFNTTDIPEHIYPRAIRVQPKDKLEITWNYPENSPHKSFYDPELLARYSSPERRRHFRFPFPRQIYWDGDLMRDSIIRTDYEVFLNDDRALHQVLLQLHLYGLTYIVNTPSSKTEGEEIINLAQRIGEVKQTFYGKTWDVKSVAQSKNIAYQPNFDTLSLDIQILI